MMHACGIDHHSGDYTDQQRADLERVLAFNARLADAIDNCRDVAAVEALLDPDPLRFMWVDEGDGRIPEFLLRADAALAAAGPLPGHRRVDSHEVAGAGAATRPSVATDDDGQVLHAWLEWEPAVGDRVHARWSDASGDEATETVLAGPADCFRPTTVVDASGRPWVAYGRSQDGEVSVRCRRYEDGSWTPEEQVSDTAHPSFNQEMVAHDDGTVEICWQGRHQGRFAVYSRVWDGSWGPTRQVGPPPDDAHPYAGRLDERSNVWDPAVTAMPGGGSAYAWTEYRAGSYRVVIARRAADGTVSPARPVTSGSDYALHPSLAATPDGALWCAFDVITVQGHGGSGPTRMRPADSLGADPAHIEGMREAGEFVPPELRPEVSASMRVVRVHDDGLAEPAGELAPHLDLVPGGLPRLAADRSGGLTIAYRVHRRLPLMTYYWEVATQALGPDGWAPPVTVRGSDGTLEEPAVAPLADGVLVAFQSDGRLERGLAWTEGFGGRECPELLDHHGAVIWHGMQRTGTVRAATIGSAGPVGPAGDLPAPVTLPVVPVLHSDERHESRAWVQSRETSPRYTTKVGDSDYSLYWGDLHRHSLISRCTAGDEPSLEDFYRYSWDVCEYDFWAVTDHSENSTDYQWWSIQKIADLFRVDGRFVPLYGFEWTGLMGHQNVIFGDVARGAPIFSAYAAGSDTPSGLWKGLAAYPDHPAITIPHHPGSAMVPYDWDYGDARFLRLAEVFQACRGNYEDEGCFRQYSDATRPGTFVLNGLRRGQRFGLIASSDHGHGASYVGAYAESLDRTAVFEALHARRVFAATTRDIVVDFRMGGAFMGSATAIDGPRVADVYARGYGELARVDIVRDGVTVHSALPDLDLADGWISVPLRVEWGMSPQTTDWSGRLEVAGGGVLPTAYWSPEIVAADQHSVQWVAHTKSFGEPYGSQRGCIEVTLAGPADAVVTVTTAQGGRTVTLGQLDGRVAHVSTDSGGRMRLQPGVGGLVGLGSNEQRVTWTDTSSAGVGEPAWYYARVIQTDGEMAWSSPVWVDPA